MTGALRLHAMRLRGCQLRAYRAARPLPHRGIPYPY